MKKFVKRFVKILKKYYKLIIIILVLIIIAVLGIFIYKEMFADGVSNRLEGIEDYSLTKKEIKSVKEKLNEIENIDSIDIATNYKIIKIFLVLKEDVDIEKVKKICNESIEEFSEKNLSFYDLEIFIESKNKESKIYPKIGYKYKTNLEFVWNR